jgi:hypothetical protein
METTKFRGRERVGWPFTFAAAAYNLVPKGVRGLVNSALDQTIRVAENGIPRAMKLSQAAGAHAFQARPVWQSPWSIALGPAYPAAQRICRAADLRGNRADRFPFRAVLAPVLRHHPYRTVADLT